MNGQEDRLRNHKCRELLNNGYISYVLIHKATSDSILVSKVNAKPPLVEQKSDDHVHEMKGN